MQAGHKHHQDVLDEAGHLEAGPQVGQGGHVVMGSACQEGRVDEVPWAHGRPVEEASVQSDEVEGDGIAVGVDPGDQCLGQGLAWGELQVHWGVQTLLPLVQAGAYLGVH